MAYSFVIKINVVRPILNYRTIMGLSGILTVKADTASPTSDLLPSVKMFGASGMMWWRVSSWVEASP